MSANSDDPMASPLPKLPEPYPAKNPKIQEHFEGALRALRPALYQVHADHARGMQVEFEQAVIVQCVLQILMLKGLITREELDQVYPSMQQMMLQLREKQLTGPRLSDPAEPNLDPKDLDCSAHHATCGAACCSSFSVLLTTDEVRSGKYLWDLAYPYRLLVDGDGTCVYFDRDKLGCSIWHDRPTACRVFDCRTDGRIWDDYSARRLSADSMAAKARLAAARAKSAAP